MSENEIRRHRLNRLRVEGTEICVELQIQRIAAALVLMQEAAAMACSSSCNTCVEDEKFAMDALRSVGDSVARVEFRDKRVRDSLTTVLRHAVTGLANEVDSKLENEHCLAPLASVSIELSIILVKLGGAYFIADAVSCLDNVTIQALAVSCMCTTACNTMQNLFHAASLILQLAVDDTEPLDDIQRGIVHAWARKLAEASFASLSLSMKDQTDRMRNEDLGVENMNCGGHCADTQDDLCVEITPHDTFLRCLMIIVGVFQPYGTGGLAPHEYFYGCRKGLDVAACLDWHLPDDDYATEAHRLSVALVFLLYSSGDVKISSMDKAVGLEKVSILIKSSNLFLSSHSYMLHVLWLHISLSNALRNTSSITESFLVQSRILRALQVYLLELDSSSGCAYESSAWRHDEEIISWLWERAIGTWSWRSVAKDMTHAWLQSLIAGNDMHEISRTTSLMIKSDHGFSMFISMLEDLLGDLAMSSKKRKNVVFLVHGVTAIDLTTCIKDALVWQKLLQVLCMRFSKVLQTQEGNLIADWVQVLKSAAQLEFGGDILSGLDVLDISEIVNQSLSCLEAISSSAKGDNKSSSQLASHIFRFFKVTLQSCALRGIVWPQIVTSPMFLEFVHKWTIDHEISANTSTHLLRFHTADLLRIVLSKCSRDPDYAQLSKMLNLTPIVSTLAETIFEKETLEDEETVEIFCGIVEHWIQHDAIQDNGENLQNMTDAEKRNSVIVVLMNVWKLLRCRLVSWHTAQIHSQSMPNICVVVMRCMIVLLTSVMTTIPNLVPHVFDDEWNQFLLAILLPHLRKLDVGIESDLARGLAIVELSDVFISKRVWWVAKVFTENLESLKDFVARVGVVDLVALQKCQAVYNKVQSTGENCDMTEFSA
ncbi:hypothetical protein BC830DRAFT_1106605 [Chytriomyces sp. MP71]|nr:hypothetical protein BC830DRAFT_1106605 [Chytriomyces sp. MP71]